MAKHAQIQSFRHLDAKKIIATGQQLERRIIERFPDSGIAKIATELVAIANECVVRAGWIAKPNLWLRTGAGILLLATITVVGGMAYSLVQGMKFADNIADVLQGLESGINEIIFLSVAVYFLFSVELRVKRSRALRAIHELRSMAHIIDMHQLTKDPERLFKSSENTRSSPERTMQPVELSRYLDYCSEMLAIVSKIAAIYAERFKDSVALSAVDEVENLVSGLSRKIWQKIMIIVAYQQASEIGPEKKRKKKKPKP